MSPTGYTYWLYMQAYFEHLPGFDLNQAGDTVTVHIPKANVLDEVAVRRFARFKSDVLEQLRKAIYHDEQEDHLRQP